MKINISSYKIFLKYIFRDIKRYDNPQRIFLTLFCDVTNFINVQIIYNDKI